jgi:hypothetical protein
VRTRARDRATYETKLVIVITAVSVTVTVGGMIE